MNVRRSNEKLKLLQTSRMQQCWPKHMYNHKTSPAVIMKTWYWWKQNHHQTNQAIIHSHVHYI